MFHRQNTRRLLSTTRVIWSTSSSRRNVLHTVLVLTEMLSEATAMQLNEAHTREATIVREGDELIRKLSAWRHDAAIDFAKFISREWLVTDCILAGQPSKNTVVDIGISQHIIESHRAATLEHFQDD